MDQPSLDRPDPACLAVRRVLVVDDDPFSAQGLALILSHEGYEVQTAADGESALVIAAAFEPDAILSDLDLPGINGHELARQVCRHPAIGSRLRILVAVSGQSEADVRQRSREAGFDRHFAKPVDPEAILALLASIVWEGEPAVPAPSLRTRPQSVSS